MKRFLFRALLLALPFTAFVVAFEVDDLRAFHNQYKAKRYLLESRAESVETLTLGNSHAFFGIVPQVVGAGTFNLAHVSQSVYYDVELALKFIPTLPRLKTVVVPISYISLESQLDSGVEAWRTYYYYHYYSIAHRLNDRAFDARNFSAYLLYGYGANEVKSRDALRDFDAWGGWIADSEGVSRTVDEFERETVAALKRHHQRMNASNIEGNLAALERLRSQLERRNIRLIFISLPVTPSYMARVNPAAYARMQQSLQRFCRASDVTYRNYMSDSRFTLNDFRDPDHLNRNGAEKFSALLSREILGAR